MPDHLNGQEPQFETAAKGQDRQGLSGAARTFPVADRTPEPRVDRYKLSLRVGRSDLLSLKCQGQRDQWSAAFEAAPDDSAKDRQLVRQGMAG